MQNVITRVCPDTAPAIISKAPSVVYYFAKRRKDGKLNKAHYHAMIIIKLLVPFVNGFA